MKKGVIILLSSLLALWSITPFSVYAESASGNSPIIGVNINIIDVDRYYQLTYAEVTLDDNADRWKCKTMASGGGACSVYESTDTTGAVVDHKIEGDLSSFSYSYTSTSIYEYEFILDASYVGYITFSSAFGTTTAKKKFVNGSSFKVTGTSLVTTFSVSSYQLYKNDLGNEWMFPIESFPWCSYLINYQWSKYYGLNSYNSYMFPLFKFSQNDVIYSGNTGGLWTWDLILYANTSINSSNITSRLSVDKTYDDEYVFKNWSMINRYNFEGSLGYLFKVQIEFKMSGSSNPFSLSYIGSNDVIIMPIYFNPVYEKSYISTDFALNFGLSNQLLDDIHYIANNTPEGQQATSNLDTGTSELTEESNDYITTETQLTDGFENTMEDMPTNFDFNSQFGNKFSNSAQWVRLQFNNLTERNPFGSLITYSLILGLALLLVGRKLL